MMWGVLVILNGLSHIFMTFHRHLQLDLGMMEKRVKLLAIYDAIPSSVWVETALQILLNPHKIKKRVWIL